MYLWGGRATVWRDSCPTRIVTKGVVGFSALLGGPAPGETSGAASAAWVDVIIDRRRNVVPVALRRCETHRSRNWGRLPLSCGALFVAVLVCRRPSPRLL